MLETKKYTIIEWIISLSDESVLDSLHSLKNEVETRETKSFNYTYSSSSYDDIKSKRVDVAALKESQNYTPTPSSELKRISEEINLEQSIDFLLADLKQMG
ncbi:MAG: hypothetical protein AAF740_01850 [Bacteroidota bacterium]